MNAFAERPRYSKGGNHLESEGVNFALYDQVVTVGGIRFFEYELLRHWEQLGLPTNWRLTALWPYTDSIGNRLDWPFAADSFLRLRRIQSDRMSRAIRYFLTSPQPPSTKSIGRIRNIVSRWLSRSPNAKIRGFVSPFDWILSQSTEFDLIYCPNPFRHLPHSFIQTFPRPLVITLHDLAHEFTDSWGERTDDIRREAASWCRLASGIVFSSDWVRQQAIKLYQIPESKTFCVHLAPAAKDDLPNAETINRVLSKYGLQSGYALCLGTSAPHKGHLAILRSFANLRREHGVNLPLVIAGPHTDAFVPGAPPISEYRLGVQQAVSNLGFTIGRDLFCLGFVPDSDVPSLYLGSSMVVTASQSEAGLNWMILDGMWYERPVVCSDLPQFVERLGESGRYAQIFPVDDPAKLTERIRNILDNPTDTANMIVRAKQFVKARTWQHVAQDYLVVFMRVLAQQNQSHSRSHFSVY